MENWYILIKEVKKMNTKGMHNEELQKKIAAKLRHYHSRGVKLSTFRDEILPYPTLYMFAYKGRRMSREKFFHLLRKLSEYEKGGEFDYEGVN